MCLAVPGQLVSVTGDDPLMRTGKVSFGGILKEVHLACVPEAKVGEYVIVHAGLAIGILDEEEAARTLQYLQQIEALGEGAPGSP
ncbi:MAG: HypC/HybG/HupF family hydrogenase formation chaperone [candidate division NC10 bacterium]|nr:HypC/HybG/HupF family hydrogenase formation chaperone [candidate division NC10 bacterium]